MQAEAGLTLCIDGAKLRRLIDECYCMSGLDLELACLQEARRDDCIDVYAATAETLALARGLGLGYRFAGVHVARVCGKRMLMLLGALELVRRCGGPKKRYVVVGDRAERLFLYGRDVLPESIVSIADPGPEKCDGLPWLVVSRRGDLLGWGRLAKREGRVIVANLVDAGWYLRSGL